ncbi:PREDICTED: uncharacterized protein LOC107095101 [Cyprinodon variegatus]|uniref:uncharacterized protein LOC107095101 n=1 Tax=Cyprinodon variegatus TaxID=28743 RepID=UPI0007427DFE|nr:PREDICTED: uncharacterized protein LOC107095101 [Cyprinodon variegatus]
MSVSVSSSQDIFSSVTEVVIKNLSHKKGLISNDNIENKWKIGTLVKIKKRSFCKYFKQRPKYTCLNATLSKIVEEEINFVTEHKPLVEDFTNSCSNKFSIEAGGDAEGIIPGGAAVKCKGEASSGKSVSSATLWTESIKEENMSDISIGDGIKLKPNVEGKFKLEEGDKLAFVKKRVYNTNSVVLKSNISGCASLGAKLNKFFSDLSGSKNEATTFTVPKNTVFAFALQEITVEDGYLKINPEEVILASIVPKEVITVEFCYNKGNPTDDFERGMETTGSSPSPEIGAEVPFFDVFRNNEETLMPLADVHESNRRGLMKTLTEILEDREALALLEDTLDQSGDDEYQPSQSKAVALFMDLLDVSKMGIDLKEAIHLLVYALNALPGNLAALLAKSGPETLNCIMSMMDSLVDGESELPESPPLPLQEEGELHAIAELILSANDLDTLNRKWDNPLITPEGLLELLYISVCGLCKMQSK